MKKGGWRSYRATTRNWHQIWIWFAGSFKGFKVQIEILGAVFDWISKQLLNSWLFLSDWYCRKLWLPDLPGHHGKATSDRKMIFISPQRNKGGNGDYCSHFSVTLETPGKFIIVFISLILGKIGIDRVTGSRREIGIRDESDLKVILKDSRWISKQQLNLLLFLSNELAGVTSHDRKVTSDKKMIFMSHQRKKDGNWDNCSHFFVIFIIWDLSVRTSWVACLLKKSNLPIKKW